MADRWVRRGPCEFQDSLGVLPEDGTTGYGIYEAAYETDMGAVTYTATDGGLIKTVATLPAGCRILDVQVIVTEAFSDTDASDVDLVVSTVTPAADANMKAGSPIQLLTALNLGNPSDGGEIDDCHSSAFAGGSDTFVASDTATATELVWCNGGTGNAAGTAANTSGKVLTYIKYIGNAAPVANLDF